MELDIKLFGFLRKYSLNKGDSFKLELPDGAIVKDIFTTLKIPDDEQRLIILNGRHADESRTLSSGDEVVLMTPIEGG